MISSSSILSMTFLIWSTTMRRMATLPAVRAFSGQSALSSTSLSFRGRRALIQRTSSAAVTSTLRIPSLTAYARQLASSSMVGDELDAALDDILGQLEGGANRADPIKPESVRVPHSHATKAATNSDDWANAVAEAIAKGEDLRALLATTHPRWVEAGIDQQIIDVLSRKGITHFTPVQAEAFSPVLAGRDVIGRSRTGTGKTLAFAMPCLARLVKLSELNGKRDVATGQMRRGRSPSMLVLCPTRELARQVCEEVSEVAKPLGLSVDVFHGGVSYDPQARALHMGLDVLVGTPGRIMDHMQRGNLALNEVDVVVLDEADEMLNMGFAEDVETILKDVGSANATKSQCLLFSATTPSWVKQLGRRYQDENVLQIDSTGEEGGARVAKTVRHLAVQLPPGIQSKRAVLEDIIAVEISKDIIDEDSDDDDEELKISNPLAYAAASIKKKGTHTMQQKIFGKTIVFTETKREADELVSGGVFKSLTAQAIHGDVGQKQRDATLKAFRTGAFNVLVATDVAARGIDIKDVDLVVQLSPPRDPDTYVHRSGRTGRAGRKGISVLLFSPQEVRDLVRIENDLGHGFKFDLVGPPSIEAALQAAARTSAMALKGVPEETVSVFRDAASSLLEEEEDAVVVVARCLAALSRRAAAVQSRSLLTGELGMVTVEMKSTQPVSANDVMFTVSKLSRMSREDEKFAFDGDVGKIQANRESGSAIFDMSVDNAKRLVEFSATVDAGGAVFSLLKALEVERGHYFGRNNDFRSDPGRYGRPERGGRFEGRGGRSDGRSWRSDGPGGGDFRQPTHGNSGGAMGRDRYGNRSSGNYNGQNHYEGRRYVTTRSGTSKRGEFRGRKNGRQGESRTSGW